MAVGCLILGDEKWYSLINEIGSTYMYFNTPSLKDVQVKQYNTTPYLMITFIEILYINAQSSMRVCQENTITQPEDMKCHSEQQVFLGDTGIVMALDTKTRIIQIQEKSQKRVPHAKQDMVMEVIMENQRSQTQAAS